MMIINSDDSEDSEDSEDDDPVGNPCSGDQGNQGD